MIMIRGADKLRDELEFAVAYEQHVHEGGAVRQVVEERVLPSMQEYDPDWLVRLSIKATVRDIREWVQGNAGRDGQVDGQALQAYLLASLITADLPIREGQSDGES